MGFWQVEHGFFSFFLPNFAIFDDCSKFYSTFGALHFEKSSNIAKIWQKMKKSLVQLALNAFLDGTSKTQTTQVSGTRSYPSLILIPII